MPETTECPSCRRQLTIAAQLLGKSVHCPCGHVFQAPATLVQPAVPFVSPDFFNPDSTAADDPFAPESPPAQAPSPKKPFDPDAVEFPSDWQQLRRGLGLFRVGLTVELITVLLFIVYRLVILDSDDTNRGAANFVGWLLFVAALANSGFCIAGQCFCLAAPAKAGVRLFTAAALVIAVVALGLMLLSALLVDFSFTDLGPNMLRRQVVGLLAGGVQALSYLVFLLVLRALAVCLEDARLAKQVVSLSIIMAFPVAGVFLAMGGFLLAILTPAALSLGIGFGVCCLFPDVFWLLGSLVWYFFLLEHVRRATAAHLVMMTAPAVLPVHAPGENRH